MKAEDRKKSYTFRLSHQTNNDLSKLAAGFHLDRTAMIEYMIAAWAHMWVYTEDTSNEEKILDASKN